MRTLLVAIFLMGVLTTSWCADGDEEDVAPLRLMKNMYPKKYQPMVLKKYRLEATSEPSTTLENVTDNNEMVTTETAISTTAGSEPNELNPEDLTTKEGELLEEVARPRKSATTTFCIEIRPSNPYQKPFQICEPAQPAPSRPHTKPYGEYQPHHSYQPQHQSYQPEVPSYHAPAPAYHAPAPAYHAPAPAYHAPPPAPAYHAPAPAYHAPAPAYHPPAPAYHPPAPAYSPPAPAYQPDEKPYQPEAKPYPQPSKYQSKYQPSEYKPQYQPAQPQYQPPEPPKYKPHSEPSGYQQSEKPSEYQPAEKPSDYQPKPSEYQPKPSEYQPKPSEYQPQASKYQQQPQTSEYQPPAQPQYQPQYQPKYESPKYQPEEPKPSYQEPDTYKQEPAQSGYQEPKPQSYYERPVVVLPHVPVAEPYHVMPKPYNKPSKMGGNVYRESGSELNTDMEMESDDENRFRTAYENQYEEYIPLPVVTKKKIKALTLLKVVKDLKKGKYDDEYRPQYYHPSQPQYESHKDTSSHGLVITCQPSAVGYNGPQMDLTKHMSLLKNLYSQAEKQYGQQSANEGYGGGYSGGHSGGYGGSSSSGGYGGGSSGGYGGGSSGGYGGGSSGGYGGGSSGGYGGGSSGGYGGGSSGGYTGSSGGYGGSSYGGSVPSSGGYVSPGTYRAATASVGGWKQGEMEERSGWKKGEMEGRSGWKKGEMEGRSGWKKNEMEGEERNPKWQGNEAEARTSEVEDTMRSSSGTWPTKEEENLVLLSSSGPMGPSPTVQMTSQKEMETTAAFRNAQNSAVKNEIENSQM